MTDEDPFDMHIQPETTFRTDGSIWFLREGQRAVMRVDVSLDANDDLIERTLPLVFTPEQLRAMAAGLTAMADKLDEAAADDPGYVQLFPLQEIKPSEAPKPLPPSLRHRRVEF